MARRSHNSRFVRTTPNMEQERFLLYRKESLIEEPSSVSDVGDQLSEYDSNASETLSLMKKGRSMLCLQSFCIKDTERTRQDDPSSCRIARFHQIYRFQFITLCRNCLCWETKNGIRDSHEKSTRFGILVKKNWERGIKTPPPLSRPSLN